MGQVVYRRQAEPGHNCVDRHAERGRGGKTAMLWEGEPGEVRKFTFLRIAWTQVQRFANVLKGLGVKNGDRVAIYMGMVPELAIAMLACARIGAVHSVIFGGFAAQAIVDRVNDSECVAVLTQDVSYRRGKEVRLKDIVDEAMDRCPTVRNVVVYRRTGTPSVTMKAGRDLWWHELMNAGGQRVSGGVDGRRRPAVHSLHLGNDGQAEGTGAYDRRLLGAELSDEQVRLRSARGRCVLVHGGHRLGDGALVCGVWAAAERRDGGDV